MPPQPNPYFSTILNPAPTAPPPSSAHPSTSTTTTAPSTTSTARPPSYSRPQNPTFTSTQQSLQARGKPFTTPSTSSPSRPSASAFSPTSTSNESYESRQRRSDAANILDSVELLIWYSGARNESIAQTRTHYQSILLGLPGQGDGERLWREEWDVPDEERVRRDADGEVVASPGRSVRGKESERERVRKRA